MRKENVVAVANYIGGRIRQAVQEGLPEVGWDGDPLLEAAFNPATQEWQVIDRATTPNQIILRKPYDGLRDLDFRDLCKRLKDAQVPRDKGVHTIFDRMNARNQAIESEALARSRNDSLEVARALYDTSKHRKTFV